jgi:hypothetical protein
MSLRRFASDWPLGVWLFFKYLSTNRQSRKGLKDARGKARPYYTGNHKSKQFIANYAFRIERIAQFPSIL